MPLKRHLLLFCLFSGALACSEKPKPDPGVVAQPDPGSLAKPAEVPSAKPIEVDRSPIAIKESPEKLALSATKLDDELVRDRVRELSEDYALRLHPLRDRMLVSYAGHVAVLEENRLELSSGIFPEESYDFTSIVGAWPHAAIAQVRFDSWKSFGYQRQAPINRTEYHWWNGANWREFSTDLAMKAAAWRKGSLLALNKQALMVVSVEEKASKEGGAKTAAPKQAAPRDPAACKDIPTEVVAEELDALPSGEAFVIGKRCGAGGYAMERWAADQAESVTDDLPDAPATAKRAFVSASAPNRVHVVVSTGEKVYAARWDGQAFRKLELKDEGDVRSVWTAADGALFFVLQAKSANPKKAKAEIVRVLPSGELSRSVSFAPSPSTKVWAADAQTAFVVSYGSILSTKPGLVFTKRKEEPKAAEPPPATRLPPFTDGCTTPFVFLYDVAAGSSKNFTFPTTRKALSTFARVADITLVEFVHDGKVRLGVKVPSAEVGRDVMAHVVANMKDEHPELTCFVPVDGVRKIDIR